MRAHRLSIAVIALLLGLIAPTMSLRAEDFAHYEFRRTWERTDLPVQNGRASRTWMWGPQPITPAIWERYQEAEDGARSVQYFDKTRMELNEREPYDSPWRVTNGLLAKELVTRQRQYGDATFVDYGPAEINVAGDPDDATGPTYATFKGLLQAPPVPVGSLITATVDRAGTVGEDSTLGRYGVTAAVLVPETNHTVASPFWAFMNSSGLIAESGLMREGPLFPNPFYATGLPISEAYWTTVRVGGVPKRVLVQVFERRVLTYTPDNPPGWQVEAGNVGQHYYRWRYELAPDRGSRNNPIPKGESARLFGDWDVRVVAVIPNATDLVLRENMFNDPPKPGYQFFIATVEATYRGQGSARFDGSFRLRALGPANVSYSTFEDSCGVIPDEISDREVFTGGTIRGNVCWQVLSTDAGNLLMYDDPFLADRYVTTFFRLMP